MMKVLAFFSLLFLTSCVSFTSYDSLERLSFLDLTSYTYQNTSYTSPKDTTRFMIFTDKESFENAFGKEKEAIDFKKYIAVALVKYSQQYAYQIQTSHVTYAQNEMIWLYETTPQKGNSPTSHITLIEKKPFTQVVFVENGRTTYTIKP